jgi:hypothetical protein
MSAATRAGPHDLLVFDEAANFLEAQVRFLLGWLRSTVKGQRKPALLTFNPPTSAEGRWIVEFFGAWLDERTPTLPCPASCAGSRPSTARTWRWTTGGPSCSARTAS